MLQNAGVAAVTVFELLKESQQGGAPPQNDPPPPRLGLTLSILNLGWTLFMKYLVTYF